MTTLNSVKLANQLRAVERDSGNYERRSMLAKQESAFLKDIENSVRQRTGTMLVRHPTSVTVNASGPLGFRMSAMVEDGRFTLYFDDWFEEFECEEIARDIFDAALKGEARLKVDILSGRRWRWTLERLDASGNWRSEGSIGHVIWRFWGRQSSIYLRNEFPPLELPAAEGADGEPMQRAN